MRSERERERASKRMEEKKQRSRLVHFRRAVGAKYCSRRAARLGPCAGWRRVGRADRKRGEPASELACGMASALIKRTGGRPAGWANRRTHERTRALGVRAPLGRRTRSLRRCRASRRAASLSLSLSFFARPQAGWRTIASAAALPSSLRLARHLASLAGAHTHTWAGPDLCARWRALFLAGGRAFIWRAASPIGGAHCYRRARARRAWQTKEWAQRKE